MKSINILIVGVGGQGTLLASRVLGAFAMARGLDVKLSEVHGMSQRGGTVVTHVKMAEKVYSPLVEEGKADYILAFEELEAFRFRRFLNPEGVLLVNDQRILPMPVIIGSAEYPADVYEKMTAEKIRFEKVDALRLALQAGDQRAVNTVMIAKLLKHLGVEEKEAVEAIKAIVKPKILDLNLKALALGYGD